MSEWQPIETAPRDGTWFVIWTKDEEPEVGKYDPTRWVDYVPSEVDGLFRREESTLYDWRGFNNFGRATHWMPLPPPPQVQP